MTIRASLDQIPHWPQRIIFSCLTDGELNNTTQTCKRVLKNVSDDEKGLRKRVADINARIQERNDDRKKIDPLQVGFYIPSITLRPDEPILRQLQDRGFEVELLNRLDGVPLRAWARVERVSQAGIAIFSGLMVAGAVTSSAPSLPWRACAVMTNAPLLNNKLGRYCGLDGLYFRPFSRETWCRFGLFASGMIQMGAGFVSLACATLGYGHLWEYRFDIALIGTGGAIIMRLLTPFTHQITQRIDEKCTRAYIKYSAHAERARRRKYYARAAGDIDKRSCCQKVTRTMDAIKRYAAGALFELIRPIARIVTPPL